MKTPTFPYSTFLAVAALACVGLCGSVNAQTTLYWQGSTTGITGGASNLIDTGSVNWNSASSGGSGTKTAFGAGSSTSNAVFQGTGGAVSLAATLPTFGDFQVNSTGYVFGVPSGGTTLNLSTFSGSALSSTVFQSSVTGTQQLTLGVSGTTDFTGTMQNGAGTLNLKKAGSGTLRLSGTNTFTGQLYLSAGALELNTNSFSSSENLVLANNTTFSVIGQDRAWSGIFSGVTSGGTSTFVGSQNLTFDSLNAATSQFCYTSSANGLSNTGTGVLTFGGTSIGISTTAGTQTATFAGTGAIVVSAAITNGTGAGANGVTIKNSGLGVTFSGLNTFTGNLLVTGILNVASVNDNNTTGVFGNSANVLQISDNGQTGTLNWTGSTNASSNKTIQIDKNGGFGVTTIANINASGTGTMTLSGGITTGGINTTAQNRILNLGGDGSGGAVISGAISNGTSTGAPPGALTLSINKNGLSTWTLSGVNTYTGATTVNAGTLTIAGSPTGVSAPTLNAGMLLLDYSTNNTSKIADAAVLTLAGGTLELSGGSHTEIVASTTLNNGTSFVKQTGGSSKLAMGAISFSGGAIDFGASSIATTTTANATGGILASAAGAARATVAGADFAANDGSGNIVAYTGYTTGYAGGAMTANTNYSMNGSASITANQGATTNALKIAPSSTGQSLAIGTGATFTIGSILFAGANDYTISTAGTGNIKPSILLNYGTGKLTLGALGGTLTQYGTGKTILTAAATADNALAVNGGTVQFSDNLQIGTNASVKGITLNIGTIIADTTSGSIALDNAGANSRTFAIGAGGGMIDVIGGNTLTVSGVISGTSSPVTFGSASTSGKIALTATNTYTGTTTISGGTLQLGNGSTAGLLATGSAIVDNANFTISRSNAVVQGTDFSSAPITGSGSFTQAGAGTTTLNASNTYSGGTTVSAGTLSFTNGTALGSSGNITVNGGTLQWGGSNAQDISSRLVFQNSGSATLDTNGNSVSLASAIGSSSSSSLTKAGTGTLTFNAASTYTGGTTVGLGTLALSGSGTLGSGTVTSSGGMIDLGGKSITNTLGTLTGGGAVNNGTITNNSGAYAVQSGSVGAVLAGSSATLTKSGAGSVTLSAANTYTGLTTISAGTLVLAGGGTIANSSGVNLGTSGSQGTLDLTAKSSGFTFGVGQTLSGYGSVTMAAGQTLTVSGFLAPGNSPGVIAISGNLALDSGATTTMDLVDNTLAPGTGFDQVVLSGSAPTLAYAGTLTLNVTTATTLGTYHLFTGFGSESGGFSAINFVGAAGAGTFNYTNGDLTLTTVPEPTTWALLAFSLTTVMVFRRRRNP